MKENGGGGGGGGGSARDRVDHSKKVERSGSGRLLDGAD